MLNSEEISDISNRISEIYFLADKHLSDEKVILILNNIKESLYDFNHFDNKLSTVKNMVISGVKFDTALVYRILGLGTKPKFTKPISCPSCSDGYITCVTTKKGVVYDVVYGCNCELGRFRVRTEKLLPYTDQELSENSALQMGKIDVTVTVEDGKQSLMEFAPNVVVEEF